MGVSPTPPDPIESFLDETLDRVSIRTALARDLRDELRAHLLEAMESGRTCEEALRDLGDPREIAENFRRLEADLPVTRDPAAVGAILAVAAVWALLLAPLSVAPAFLWGVLGGDGGTLRLLFDSGQIARAALAALSGAAAYRLALRLRGNPRRITPFVALSVLLFAAAMLTRFDLFVARPVPDPRWNAFLIADLPGLGSYALDLDRSGIPAACRVPVLWSRIDLPLRTAHLHAGFLALGAVALGTVQAILRPREDAAHA